MGPIVGIAPFAGSKDIMVRYPFVCFLFFGGEVIIWSFRAKTGGRGGAFAKLLRYVGFDFFLFFRRMRVYMYSM